MGTASAWTAERRARQADAIRRTKPWEKSTGPVTEQGKAVSARNAYAGDWYLDARANLADIRAATFNVVGRRS